MKRFMISFALMLTSIMMASAEEWKLTTPEMKPELTYRQAIPDLDRTLPLATASPLTAPSVSTQAWMETRPEVKPYKVMDDLTFVGIPVFIAGWAIKGDKANFRQDYNNTHSNTRLITNFKTGIDDYTQYFGPAMTVGLKLAGVENRSDWARLLASAAMSYGIMAGFVNGIKYTASEMRPDGSTANSWPSGHTATSFVGATILHKEYGLTRSPWYSVAGYSVATATGVMRILNNRHWISDVLSGAGIGIMSTELGYALGDILFKGKGLLRNNLEATGDNPSFFSISMGLGYGLKELDFTAAEITSHNEYEVDEAPTFNVDFHTGTVVGAEGAYFFNKYIGVGGKLSVRAMTAKSWKDFVQMGSDDQKILGQTIIESITEVSSIGRDAIVKEMANICSDQEFTVESDHLTEFSANVGLFFNLPLSSRFALGSKLLIGRTMTQELDINAHFKGDMKDVFFTSNTTYDEKGLDVNLDITKFQSAGYAYDEEWDYLTMGGNNSTTFGTGLSLSYRYKSNFTWKVFVDYDYSKKTFTLNYDPFRFLWIATPTLAMLYDQYGFNINPVTYELEKKVNYFTIGGSFAISF